MNRFALLSLYRSVTRHKLYAALKCEKTHLKLAADTGAGGHCGGLGQLVWAQAVYDWLEAALARRG